MSEIWAIILAAGESKRMKTPKMLLPYHGTTIIERVVQNVLDSNVDNTVVVLGSEKNKILKVIGNMPVKNCYNENFDQGMLSSVICGFKSLPEDFGAALVILGDQPGIGPEIINEIIDAYRKSGKGIIIPVYNKRRGHPLLVDFKYMEEIYKLDMKEGLRSLAGRCQDDLLEVALATSDILWDIDTPEDYKNALKGNTKCGKEYE